LRKKHPEQKIIDFKCQLLLDNIYTPPPYMNSLSLSYYKLINSYQILLLDSKFIKFKPKNIKFFKPKKSLTKSLSYSLSLSVHIILKSSRKVYIGYIQKHNTLLPIYSKDNCPFNSLILLILLEQLHKIVI
jgi:hypothetical protein